MIVSGIGIFLHKIGISLLICRNLPFVSIENVHTFATESGKSLIPETKYNKKIERNTIMKTMYKMIVAMMIMAITAAPAIAANKVDRDNRSDRKEMRMTDCKNDKKVDKKHDRHSASLEMFTFKVSHKASKKKNVVAAAKAIHGVKDVKWNPRTSMMTVTYDAHKTSARSIKAAVN